MPTPPVDVAATRRSVRAELEQALAGAGGKTRKRSYRAMVRAVTEHRGTTLDAPDDDVVVWSDLHLGHANIIEYQERPFLDVGDQDAEIWRAWERIDAGAVLVVVGDVALGAGVGKMTWERVRHSPGRHKHLVIGNIYRAIVCNLPGRLHARNTRTRRAALKRTPPLTGTPWDALLAVIAEHSSRTNTDATRTRSTTTSSSKRSSTPMGRLVRWTLSGLHGAEQRVELHALGRLGIAELVCMVRFAFGAQLAPWRQWLSQWVDDPERPLPSLHASIRIESASELVGIDIDADIASGDDRRIDEDGTTYVKLNGIMYWLVRKNLT